MRNTCNCSATALVNDVTGNTVEDEYSLLLVRCDDHQSFSKCLEASEHRYEFFNQEGCEFTTKKLRDARV